MHGRIKRGTSNSSGLVFWRHSRGNEHWVTPKVFSERQKSFRAYAKTHWSSNRERINARNRAWRAANSRHVKSHNNAYKKARRAKDILYKLRCYLSTSISAALSEHGFKRNSRTAAIVGCSFEELRVHIQEQFQPGMDWDNYGKWHIDHRIPISHGLTVSAIERLSHFTNLQPMWAKQNQAKGNRFSS
jgi:hypothetical protein